MKLRTSYFNPTAFKKDVLRFAPSWAIYSIVLLMYLMICCISRSEYHRASSVADCIAGMAVVNLIYGLLNAQLLFGDLYNARLCNALHAMPMRRECWFLTHTAAGLAFSFVPNLAAALIALPLLGGGWSVALWWLLASCLQYLCFFGLASLSALCVGNRFAMAVVYGIINFLSMLVYWFYATLYEPLLYGVQNDGNLFLAWCPVAQMVDNYNMVDVARYSGQTYYDYTIRAIYLGEGWGYLTICAAVGAVLLGLALVLYRRRNLEAAGDFMAIRALEPVFLVLYTITLGAFFHLFSDIFFSVHSNYVFLGLGLVVGFFTGRMLLKRTVRVFQPKAFLGFGILVAVMVLSLLLTFWDVLGVTRRIPKTGDVETVRVTDHLYTYNYNGYGMTLDTPQEVDGIRQFHQMILNGETQPTHTGESVYTVSVALVYELKNGATVSRFYNMAVDSPAGLVLKDYYTSTEYILGLPAEQTSELLDTLDYIYIRTDDGDGQQDPNSQIAKGLVRAIIADCEAGNMAQAYGYHGDAAAVSWVEVGFRQENGNTRYVNLNIFPDAAHTIAYLRENGFPIYDENYVAENK